MGDERDLAAEFRTWVEDPTRTNDELFTAELLVDWGRTVWGWKHEKPRDFDWPAMAAHRKERASNPAYRPRIDPALLEATVEVWAQVDKFSPNQWSDDRPVRDLSALRFFPHLVEVSVGECEADLAPLAGLRKLRKVSIREPLSDGGFVIQDLAPLAGLPELEELSLWLQTPWPDLSALGELPALRTLSFHGNVLALRGVEALPKATVVTLEPTFHWKTPARDFYELPAMPEIQRLKVNPVDSLRGLERVGGVVNLDLTGPFRDLAPLAGLEQATALRLEGEMFGEVAPLARMPALLDLTIAREHPFNVAPLVEAPMLREVQVERCDILKTEVAALNAVITPWVEDFLAPEPRTLPPLKFLWYGNQSDDFVKLRALPAKDEAREAFYRGDTGYAAAEGRWFHRELQRRLDELLGRGWGLLWRGRQRHDGSAPGYAMVFVRRYRDVVRLEEIFQTMREFLAGCRFPWQIWMIVEPHGDMIDDMAEIRRLDAEEGGERPWLDDVRESSEDREDYRKMRRERYARMQREHRFRTLEELGEKIDPQEFSTLPAAASPSEGEPEEDDEVEDDEVDGDEVDGDVAVAEPPPEGARSLAQDLSFQLHLTEEALLVVHHMRAKAESALGWTAENWHDLPEPLERRPYPRH